MNDAASTTSATSPGWLAYIHPDFVRQTKRDPAAVVATALEQLAAKFKLNDGHARSG